jgi:CBS-domain-containing membrane protein
MAADSKTQERIGVSKNYQILNATPLQKGASYMTPRQHLPPHVSLRDPAEMVMTDFSIVTVHTITAMDTIEVARARMIHYAVRLLLVVDDMNAILGLVTATDLTSEKPMQIIQSQGIRHNDVLVKDIMTPREKLQVLCGPDVTKACVGDIVATLQAQVRQHALVADRQNDNSQVLRGMFSATQISRQLGMPVSTIGPLNTFAEIGAHLKD